MCSKCDWEDVLSQIEEMLDDPDYDFARDTLEGIKEWVEEREHCTVRQRTAVENIYDSIASR